MSHLGWIYKLISGEIDQHHRLRLFLEANHLYDAIERNNDIQWEIRGSFEIGEKDGQFGDATEMGLIAINTGLTRQDMVDSSDLELVLRIALKVYNRQIRRTP